MSGRNEAREEGKGQVIKGLHTTVDFILTTLKSTGSILLAESSFFPGGKRPAGGYCCNRQGGVRLSQAVTLLTPRGKGAPAGPWQADRMDWTCEQPDGRTSLQLWMPRGSEAGPSALEKSL